MDKDRGTGTGTEGQGEMYRDRGMGRRKREVDRNIGRNGDTVRGTEGQEQVDSGAGRDTQK